MSDLRKIKTIKDYEDWRDERDPQEPVVEATTELLEEMLNRAKAKKAGEEA